MGKTFLRKKYLKIRKNINEAERVKYNDDIFNKIINLQEYKASSLVLIYVSLKYEVDTFKLITYSLNSGKKVAVPKCIGNNIMFYYIKNLDELEKNSFKILEPKTNNVVGDFNNSICIVPSIAFDKKNNRIGYGKGFYDRFLKKYSGLKIGITYKQCICEDIDLDVNDVRMDEVISNN